MYLKKNKNWWVDVKIHSPSLNVLVFWVYLFIDRAPVLVNLPEDISVIRNSTPPKKKEVQGILGENNHISTKIQTNESPTVSSWKITVSSKDGNL